jgi:FlaA1/EpsC-like NDP-sugar epimerase
MTELKQTLEKILSMQPHSVSDMTEQIRGREIFLYGAGNVGGQILDVLRRHDLEPAAFLDRSAVPGQKKDGVAVFSPDDASLSRAQRSSASVFVSILLDKEPRAALYETLKSLGYVDLKYAFPWVMRSRKDGERERERICR